MNGWLLYDRARASGSAFLIDRYFRACEREGAGLELVFAEDILPCVRESRPSVSALASGRELCVPDFVICRTVMPALSRHLELCGARVFNSADASLLCNDKSRSYAAAAAAGARVTDSVFVSGGGVPGGLEFPQVLKPAWGSGGRDVILARGADEAARHMRESGGEQWVFQRPSPVTGRDLRAYVLGGKVVCAILRESDGDFRANFCLGARASVYSLTDGERESIERLAMRFDFDLVGADFLFDAEGGLIFNEFEDVVGARALYSLTDIDIAALYVRHIVDAVRRGV